MWIRLRQAETLRSSLHYLCLLGLFFFVGFRYKVGCDWAGIWSFLTRHAIHTIETTALPQNEVAFWAINKLLSDFALEYPYINVIAAWLFFLGLHVLAKTPA